ncbi:hypothetical protein SOP85_31145, partial [Pseudomonas sp. YuFO20]|uniref:hypothetical protein n=1 Tax=Pseudomonas sp. YuFO20 TaxID=3095362 RepID=UPI002B24EAC1
DAIFEDAFAGKPGSYRSAATSANHCRSRLAGEEARKVDAIFEDAFAGKPGSYRSAATSANHCRSRLASEEAR